MTAYCRYDSNYIKQRNISSLRSLLWQTPKWLGKNWMYNYAFCSDHLIFLYLENRWQIAASGIVRWISWSSRSARGSPEPRPCAGSRTGRRPPKTVTSNRCIREGSGCVAQLVERSLPIPEVRGSNPVISKIYWTFVYCQLCIEKTKIKKKRGREWPIFKRRLPVLFKSIYKLRIKFEMIYIFN